MQKGANTAGKRNALGRGLSALMSSSKVNVEVVLPPQTETKLENKSQSNAEGKKAEVLQIKRENIRYVEPESSSDTDAEKSPSKSASEQLSEITNGLLMVPIERIFPNPNQPRKRFSTEEIASLSSSIRETGLIQPIIVRKHSSSSGSVQQFEIVAGERRFRAARDAGLTTVPVLLRELTDKEALELGIIENIQRADLNPIEEAEAYQRLINEFGESQQDVAKSVGKDRASIANALRLLKLPPEVLRHIVEGRLSAGHGRALLMADTPAKQRFLAEKIIKEALSVRAAEQLSQGAGAEKKAARKQGSAVQKAPNILQLEDRLRRALGTKVQLQFGSGESGELKISFFSRAELETVLERLGVSR